MSDIRSNLPVVDTSDGTPGSAAPSVAQQIAGTDGTNLRALLTDKNGSLVVGSELAYLAAQGKMFSADYDVSLTNTAETNSIYVKNPSTSGINMKFVFLNAATDSTQGIMTTRFYINPTVTANGTAVNVASTLISASAPAAAVQVFSNPTVSSRGNKAITLVNSVNLIVGTSNIERTVIVTPGNSVLITCQAANIGLLSSVTCHYYLQWTEET